MKSPLGVSCISRAVLRYVGICLHLFGSLASGPQTRYFNLAYIMLRVSRVLTQTGVVCDWSRLKCRFRL